MKKHDKEVQQAFLDEEKRVLAKLEDSYEEALIEINNKIEMLMARNDADLQHVIYQIEYQRALKTQVQATLENLQANEFETVSEYLTNSYTNGYIGAMYSMHKQGVPLIIPIDQSQVVEAIKHDTKLSTSLYTALGHDIKDLQKKISSEISRGIATGQGYGQIARNIAAYSKVPLNNAMRIARTESHRIQCKSAMDAQYKAKAKGADVVKQWDAALDGNTRPHHRMLEGQIRELDEPFEVGGMKAMFPGDFGDPAEDCNCRCALLQIPRWALDDEELENLKGRAEYFGLDKTKDFEEYKEKYLKAADSDTVRSDAQKTQKVAETLENTGKNGIIKVTRGQLDTGYSGKIPDDKLEEYNKKAFEQIKLDTGYSDEEAKEFHNALLNYFGGDYEAILSGETETAKIIKKGIDRMPTYDGAVYRGMTFSNEDIKMFSNLKPGDSLPQKGIIESWSSNERVAVSFGGANDYYRSSIILECESNRTGVGVQHISKFGAREAEVLTSANYEVVEVIIENKYDYLSAHKELLYSPDDLDWVEDDVKENIVCRIKVKEI